MYQAAVHALSQLQRMTADWGKAAVAGVVSLGSTGLIAAHQQPQAQSAGGASSHHSTASSGTTGHAGASSSGSSTGRPAAVVLDPVDTVPLSAAVVREVFAVTVRVLVASHPHNFTVLRPDAVGSTGMN